MDRALQLVFSRYAVDPAHLALDGFSDGASYALSLGLGNGDLFSHLLGFSPGFLAPAGQVGRPRIFVSHGTADRVLPVERCGRVIRDQLRGAGYDLHYREFAGGHTVPSEVQAEALAWWLG
ncbi:alpha/beta hydrolase [Deinococcus lacus]|uniref:Alpha/beta hydrolase n=1 Tax=Deinococcus lacus TaxID=392561 RepID=A0ABW1YGS5_9DEIO